MMDKHVHIGNRYCYLSNYQKWELAKLASLLRLASFFR